VKASVCVQHTPLRVIVKLTNAPEVRFFTTLGQEAEVEVASLAPACNSRNTKRPELTFHAVLGDDLREVRFERVLALDAFGHGARNMGFRAHSCESTLYEEETV
jgi:hypothetical protein